MVPRNVSSVSEQCDELDTGWSRAVRLFVLVGFLLAGGALEQSLEAQQRIGHVDTEYILNEIPEYSAVQQKLDQLEARWRKEIQRQERKVQELREEFEAREVLYTSEERKQRRKEIDKAQRKVERLREEYFGPDGKLYARQKELMRPLQERILKAVESVATSAGYDYVLDKKGDTLFLFAEEEHSLSDRVLQELGINVDRAQGQE